MAITDAEAVELRRELRDGASIGATLIEDGSVTP